MKDRPSLLKSLALLWSMLAVALCVVILFVTPEQISALFNIDAGHISRYDAIGKLIENQLLAIDTIIGKVILATMVIITWAAGRLAILCVNGLANLAHEEF